MVGWQGVHQHPGISLSHAYNDFSSNKTMIYTVCCPKLDEREECYSQDHAIDVAYSMHDESDSYVWVEDYLGHTFIELGDIFEGITELVFL